MALVDTAVWISHLRDGNDRLAELLNTGEVVCHPFIIGELACGDLKNRTEILALLDALPKAPMVEHAEVLAFVEGHTLWGRGLGYVDVHLLAAALLSGAPLWTLDKQLDKTAAGLHCRYESAS